MDRWVGRVALVTGASAGMGAAISRSLVQHGLIVVGCARNTQSILQVYRLSVYSRLDILLKNLHFYFRCQRN